MVNKFKLMCGNYSSNIDFGESDLPEVLSCYVEDIFINNDITKYSHVYFHNNFVLKYIKDISFFDGHYAFIDGAMRCTQVVYDFLLCRLYGIDFINTNTIFTDKYGSPLIVKDDLVRIIGIIGVVSCCCWHKRADYINWLTNYFGDNKKAINIFNMLVKMGVLIKGKIHKSYKIYAKTV